MSDLVKGHIIFDHDGTLVNVGSGNYQLFPGILELLQELKAENFALYIWTARPRSSTQAIINQLNIAKYFLEISCVDDCLGKPHPQGLEQLTAGVDKKRILHIGDSTTDIEGATAYGIDVIAACWNNPKQAEYFKKLTPLIASEVKEVKKIIRGKYV